MAKRPKGFGKPVPSKPKKSSKKPPPKSIEITLTPLADTEFLEEKEARLRQIFASNTVIPEVSTDSLKHYHQYLKSHLTSETMLISEEPFSWEDPYIYGRNSITAHQAQREQHPSYLDHFHFISLSDHIQKTGIEIEVQRHSDHQIFTLPLVKFKVDQTVHADPTGVIADYRFWWRNYQPTFP